MPMSRTALAFALVSMPALVAILIHAFVHPLPETVTAPAATVAIIAIIVILLDGWLTRMPVPLDRQPGHPYSWSNQSTYVIAIWDDRKAVDPTWPWPGVGSSDNTWIAVFHRATRKCLVVCPCPPLYVPGTNMHARLHQLAAKMGFRVAGTPRHGFSPAETVELDVEAEVQIIPPRPPSPGEPMLTTPVAFPPVWCDGRVERRTVVES